MKRWIQVVLFSLFFFALVVLVNFQYKANYSDRIVGCRPSSITSIKINNQDTVPLLLEKDPDSSTWKMTSGLWQTELAEKAANRLTYLVCLLSYREKLEIPLNEREAFGIDERSPRIRFKGEVEGDLLLGNLTPEGTEYYLASSLDKKNIYTFSNITYSELFPPAVALTERAILRSFPADNMSFSNSEEPVFDLKFQDGKWLESHQKLSAEQAGMLAQLIQDLRFANYIGPMDRIEAEEYGFSLPDIIIELESSSLQQVRHVEVSFFRNSTFLYTKFFGQDYVFVLEPAVSVAFYQAHHDLFFTSQ